MNKNSNGYQILYSAIMVLLVGTALAFVYMQLRPTQVRNEDNDKRMQILSSIHVSATAADADKKFEKYIIAEYNVDQNGNIVDSTKNTAFKVDMKNNVKLDPSKRRLPVYVSRTDNGEIKYILPVYGAGLWGPIWGYVSLNADGNTIYGANYSHQGETPGLGARITEEQFSNEFKDKHLFVDGTFKSVEVMKKGQKPTDGADYVDAITGATITSRGVQSMLHDCLKYYEPFLAKQQKPQVK